MGTTLFAILGLLPQGSTTYILHSILGWYPPPQKAPTLKISHTCRFGTTLPPPGQKKAVKIQNMEKSKTAHKSLDTIIIQL